MAENQDLNITDIEQEILGQGSSKFQEAPEEDKNNEERPEGVPKPLSPYILFMKALK